MGVSIGGRAFLSKPRNGVTENNPGQIRRRALRVRTPPIETVFVAFVVFVGFCKTFLGAAPPHCAFLCLFVAILCSLRFLSCIQIFTLHFCPTPPTLFSVTRRAFMQSGLAIGFATPLFAALKREGMDEAVETLTQATREGQVAAAVLHVVQRHKSFTRSFGKAQSEDAMFLLGSISKPITVTALMTLFDRGEFKLSDPLKKFIPQFTGDHRDEVTMQHLLTHVSGLPDQLPENNQLRSRHPPLLEFAEHAIRTPLQFVPGSKYQYSSMAILLAARVAELISGTDIRTLVDRAVFQPLQMRHSAL